MAIAHYKPTVTTAVLPQQSSALPDNYKGNIFDNKKVPLSGLLSYIAGAPWSVTYYRQILSEHNDIKELDSDLDPTYQSYEQIIGLEIRVEGELTASTTTDTQQTVVKGSGLVYPFIVPNRNDYFITDTSLGKKALFLVRTAERKTFQEQSVHSLEYILVRYMDDTDDLFQSLSAKVVRTFYFSKDRLVQGLSPLLKTETYHELLELDNSYSKLVRTYFKTFMNQRCMSLVVPGQSELIYDPFLVKFLLAIVESGDAPELRRIKRYQTDEDIFIDQSQIWDVLLSRDPSLLQWCNRRMGTTSLSNFDGNSFIRDAYHGIMSRLVYPIDADTSTLSGGQAIPKFSDASLLTPTTDGKGGHMLPSENTHALLNSVVTVFPPIDFENTYLFTPAFYDGEGTLSLLEILVRDYISNQTLKHSYLNVVVNLYPKLDRMEQFYYGPVLLLLLKAATSSTY